MRMLPRLPLTALLLGLLALPLTAFASEASSTLDLTTTWFGIGSIITFVIAYSMVIGEEVLHLRKSKPVIVAAGIIWTLVGIAYAMHGAIPI